MLMEEKRSIRVILAISEAERFVYNSAQPSEKLHDAVEILLKYIERIENRLDQKIGATSAR